MVFLGTPEFAVPSLEMLLKDDHFEVVGVVSQPDRPAGRKLELKPSPVKVLAQAHGLRILTPEKIGDASVMEQIATWNAEAAVVVAFGQLLSQKFLNMFPHGCVNVHGSLLPRWRGAAPMQRSLMAGDTETGVALQKMVFELDAGDILGVRKVAITDDTDARSLSETLRQLAADLIHVEFMDFVRGNLAGHPQDPALVTLAPKIKKEESLIRWDQPARDIFNKIRGLTLGPVAHTFFNGQRLKIWRTRVTASTTKAQPGTVVTNDGKLEVACGQGVLELLEVQPESKKAMTATEFVRGYRINQGDMFA